jgi:hypothetical protein
MIKYAFFVTAIFTATLLGHEADRTFDLTMPISLRTSIEKNSQLSTNGLMILERLAEHDTLVANGFFELITYKGSLANLRKKTTSFHTLLDQAVSNGAIPHDIADEVHRYLIQITRGQRKKLLGLVLGVSATVVTLAALICMARQYKKRKGEQIDLTSGSPLTTTEVWRQARYFEGKNWVVHQADANSLGRQSTVPIHLGEVYEFLQHVGSVPAHRCIFKTRELLADYPVSPGEIHDFAINQPERFLEFCHNEYIAAEHFLTLLDNQKREVFTRALINPNVLLALGELMTNAITQSLFVPYVQQAGFSYVATSIQASHPVILPLAEIALYSRETHTQMGPESDGFEVLMFTHIDPVLLAAPWTSLTDTALGLWYLRCKSMLQRAPEGLGDRRHLYEDRIFVIEGSLDTFFANPLRHRAILLALLMSNEQNSDLARHIYGRFFSDLLENRQRDEWIQVMLCPEFRYWDVFRQILDRFRRDVLHMGSRNMTKQEFEGVEKYFGSLMDVCLALNNRLLAAGEADELWGMSFLRALSSELGHQRYGPTFTTMLESVLDRWLSFGSEQVCKKVRHCVLRHLFRTYKPDTKTLLKKLFPKIVNPHIVRLLQESVETLAHTQAAGDPCELNTIVENIKQLFDEYVAVHGKVTRFFPIQSFYTLESVRGVLFDEHPVVLGRQLFDRWFEYEDERGFV